MGSDVTFLSNVMFIRTREIYRNENHFHRGNNSSLIIQ